MQGVRACQIERTSHPIPERSGWCPSPPCRARSRPTARCLHGSGSDCPDGHASCAPGGSPAGRTGECRRHGQRVRDDGFCGGRDRGDADIQGPGELRGSYSGIGHECVTDNTAREPSCGNNCHNCRSERNNVPSVCDGAGPLRSQEAGHGPLDRGTVDERSVGSVIGRGPGCPGS